MKKINKPLLLSSILLVFTNAQADLVLKWGSIITQNHPAVVSEYQPDAQFGSTLSSANNVLYIGSRKYIHTSDIQSGAVHKLVGTINQPLGNHPHNKLIHQGHISNDSAEQADRFGSAMVVVKGEVENEEQLVIGVKNKTIDGITGAGLIHNIQSICDDCTDTVITNISFHQNTGGIIGTAEEFDLFGELLIAGDFNGDGYEDIAIGLADEDLNTITDAGAVQIIMSAGPAGLAVNNNRFWSRSSTGILEIAEQHDDFGHAMASGDFNGDGVDDLAIGIPGANVNGEDSAGSVQILYGVLESSQATHDNGLDVVGYQVWNQDSPGIGGGSERDDRFGRSLAAGDFNGDGVDDLAIGVPNEDIGGEVDAGTVNIIYGSIGAGLTAIGDLFISQDEPGFVGASEAGDYFGWSLAVGDLNADGIDDLAIGALGEDINDVVDTGAVYIVHGSNSGLQFSDEYTITEGNIGGTQGIRARSNIGYSMTINDFDGDGKDDLAIKPDSLHDDEYIIVIYQQDYDVLFVDGFEN